MRVTALVTLSLLLPVLAGCGGRAARHASSVPVTVARVEARTVPFEVEATGTVEPQQTVEMLSQVGGTVDRIAFREGDFVHRGQVLFQLDPRPLRATLDQARAVLDRDRAQAGNARRDAERSRELLAQNLVAPGEDEAKQATAAALEATVEADSAAVENAALNLQYATLRAPIDGRTGSLRVHVGDLIKANDSGNPMVTINRMDPVRVRFTVPQDALPAVLRSRREALPVLVSTADRDTFDHRGHLVFVDNAVDPTTGTLLLKGEFPNRDESLWPGEFVRVRLVLGSERDALVVPAAAVTDGPNGTFVYVVGADSTVSVRPVGVRRTFRQMTLLSHGVKAGETVVTDGQLRLGPGARIALRPPAEAPAAPDGDGSGAEPAAAAGRGAP